MYLCTNKALALLEYLSEQPVLRAVVHERGEGHDVRRYPTRQHLHTGLVISIEV